MSASSGSGVLVSNNAALALPVDHFRVNPRVMMTNAQDIVDNMIKQNLYSLHPDLFKGLDTKVDLSWTVVGYDLLNHKFPDSMNMEGCRLDPKLLKDLETIVEALPRAVRILGGSGVPVAASSGVPESGGIPVELARIIGAWMNLCQKATTRGTLVYSVVMTHAWLNNVPVSMYTDLHERYLWIDNPGKFDFGWHLHDFVMGARACLMKLGALSNSIDVSRMSGVEVFRGSLREQNWHLINAEYTKEDFIKAKFGEGIVPFFNDADIMDNYVLDPWTTKCFPEGGYYASTHITWFIEGRGKYFYMFPSSGVEVFKLPGDFIKGRFIPGGHTSTYSCVYKTHFLFLVSQCHYV